MSFLSRMASSFEELVLLIKQLVELNKNSIKCADCHKEIDTKDVGDRDAVDELQNMIPRKEVISILKIDPSTYTRWSEKGIIRTVTIGGRSYVRKDDLADAIKESRRKGKI